MKTFLRYAITTALAAITFSSPKGYAAPGAVTEQQQAKPLSFIENKGQITDQHGRRRSDIDYKLETPGMNIYVGDAQIHYQWMQEGTDKKVNTYRMDVVLVGANKQAQLVAAEQQAYYEQYYLPQCSEGATAHTYNRITYKNIYPHIDWVIYSKNNELKYDFVVHPGGNPKQIKLRYEGATKLALNDGAVTAATPMGSITEQPPYSYLASTGGQIASRYKLDGNSLQYELAQAEGTLVIDPTLNWATYYGGAGSEGASEYSCAMDAPGNIYLTSETGSTSNIATTGAHQTSITGNNADVYLAKFNSTGVRQWATYYGGTQRDEEPQAACDALGNIYLSGMTISSSGIATGGAHQTSLGGLTDAFLVKFNTAGVRQWATYYGGSAGENAYALTCDPAGNVYIGGQTTSSSGIATTGSHQSSLSVAPPPNNTAVDAYIVKFNGAGVRQWGTYYGGTAGEDLHGLACDPAGNVYAAGGTTSTSGIATTGAFQATIPSTAGPCGFIVKFNGSGVRQWGTYNSLAIAQAMVCSSTDVYVCGYIGTSSYATAGAHQGTLAGGTDGFLSKFDQAGSRSWSTYFGGSNNDDFHGIGLDGSGNVYLAGTTRSTSGIATGNAIQPTYGGGNDDGMLAQFSPSGSLLFASYYGGTTWDYFGQDGDTYPSNVAASNGAYFAVAGATTSTANIATTGAHQTIHAGGTHDNMLVVLGTDTMVYITQPFNDTVVCPLDTLHVGYGVAPVFRSGNTFTVQLSDASGSFASPVSIGSVTATGSGTINAVVPANITAGTGYRIRIVSSAPARNSQNNGKDIRVKSAPVLPTASNNGPVCVGQNLTVDVSSNTSGVTYSWSGPNSFSSTTKNPTITSATAAASGDYRVAVTLTSSGCVLRDTTTAIVQALPATPVAGNNGPICAGDQLSLTASSATTGSSYSWTGPNSYTSGFQNPTISSTTTANSGTYSVVATANGCVSLPATTNVTIKPLPVLPNITTNSPVCLGGTLTLDAASDPGSTYEWTGPAGFTSTLKSTSIAAVTKAAQGTYAVRATLNGCMSNTATAFVTVNIVANIGGYASPNDTICKGASVTFVGFPQNGGSSPTFEWFKNGLPISSNKVYTTSDVATGDKFWCTMTAYNICGATPVVITTDTIRMVVLNMQVTPSVKISATPGVTGDPAQLIQFLATAQWGGTTPKYMWYKNGTPTGNTNATWSTTGIRIGDEIAVEMESEHPCAPMMKVYDTVRVQFPAGVKDNSKNTTLSLYPNPNRGSFAIDGVSGREVRISIVNVLGQVVYSETQRDIRSTMNLDVKLVPGAYLLRMVGDGVSYSLRFNVVAP